MSQINSKYVETPSCKNLWVFERVASSWKPSSSFSVVHQGGRRAAQTNWFVADCHSCCAGEPWSTSSWRNQVLRGRSLCENSHNKCSIFTHLKDHFIWRPKLIYHHGLKKQNNFIYMYFFFSRLLQTQLTSTPCWWPHPKMKSSTSHQKQFKTRWRSSSTISHSPISLRRYVIFSSSLAGSKALDTFCNYLK